MFARTSPLQDGVAVYKVDAWGFKAALFLPVAVVHVQTEVVFGCFFFFFFFLFLSFFEVSKTSKVVSSAPAVSGVNFLLRARAGGFILLGARGVCVCVCVCVCVWGGDVFAFILSQNIITASFHYTTQCYL